jgi:hypothetical protein
LVCAIFSSSVVHCLGYLAVSLGCFAVHRFDQIFMALLENSCSALFPHSPTSSRLPSSSSTPLYLDESWFVAVLGQVGFEPATSRAVRSTSPHSHSSAKLDSRLRRAALCARRRLIPTA